MKRLFAFALLLAACGAAPADGCNVAPSLPAVVGPDIPAFATPIGFYSNTAEAVNLDFTQASAPAGVTVSRADSATVYPANSTVTGVTATTGPVRECRTMFDGTIGCGWWVWPSIPANLITAANLCATGSGLTGWTLQGTPTVACASTTGPDGVTNSADTIQDTSAGAQQYQYIGNGGTGLVVMRCMWAQSLSPAATPEAGGLQADLGNHLYGQNVNLSNGNWQYLCGVDNISQYAAVIPAGYIQYDANGHAGSIDAAGVGKTGVWGPWEAATTIRYPYCNAGTGSQTIQLSAGTAAKFVKGGDFTASVEWISEVGGNGDFSYPGSTSVYPLQLATPDGELSIRWEQSRGEWDFKVRGVDLNPGASAVMNGWPADALMRIDAWYLVSTGKWGIRVTVDNSSDSYFITGSTTGSALSAPTGGYIGSNAGASSMAGLITNVRTNFSRPNFNQSIEKFGEILMIGDSISGSVNSFTLADGAIYTVNEARTRPGIVTLARAGDTVAQQQSRFDASPVKTSTKILAVNIGPLGINDLLGTSCGGANCTDVQVETALTALYNDVHAAYPGVPINITTLTPANNYPMTGTQYTYWQNVNTWIRANSLGATHVDDLIRSQSNDPINADSMQPMYTDDHLHMRNNGRFCVQSKNWRADFIGFSVPLPDSPTYSCHN